MAWIGYPQGQAGGICDRYANFGGKLRSYNTGLVTFKLYARDLPPAVTEITFAHELGHAFGAHVSKLTSFDHESSYVCLSGLTHMAKCIAFLFQPK